MYLGDFGFGSTVYFKFTTVNSTGAPASFSSGGVTVYRNDSTVEDTTGLALTSTFDAITGLNHVTVSMSTVGFYSSAGNFTAVISSGAASENLAGYVLAHWSVRNRFSRISTAVDISTGSSISSVGTVTGDVAGNVTGTIGALTTAAAVDVNDEVAAALATYGGPTKAELDANSTASDALWLTYKLDRFISTAGSSDDVANNSLIAQMVSAAATPSWVSFNTTTDSLEAIRDRGDAAWVTASGFSTFVVASESVTVSTAATITSVTSVSNAVGISTASAIDSVTSVSNAVSISTASSIDGVTSVNSTVDANLAQILGSSADALTFRDHVIAQTTGIALAGSSREFINTDLAETTPDHYNGLILKFISGNLDGQASDISDYSSTGKITFGSTLTEVPSSGDKFILA